MNQAKEMARIAYEALSEKGRRYQGNRYFRYFCSCRLLSYRSW